MSISAEAKASHARATDSRCHDEELIIMLIAAAAMNGTICYAGMVRCLINAANSEHTA